MKIAVAGSRVYTDYKEVAEYIDMCIREYTDNEQITILSGGCRGADMLGERYAMEHGYRIARFCAQWDKFGKAAGIIRSRKIADTADLVVCFWDGDSRGTKTLIDYARKLGKTVCIKYV